MGLVRVRGGGKGYGEESLRCVIRIVRKRGKGHGEKGL